MATLILVRHGRTTANSTGVLAGRSPGVSLDDTGEQQAAVVAERLSVLPLSRIVSSPLERCRQTAAMLARAQESRPRVRVERRLTECGYGAWTGRPLKELAKEPLWKTVQGHPSGVTFPDGESMRDMQSRAVGSVRRADAEIEDESGPDAVWAAVSHGDVIKSVLADALGLHLDQFQRLVVDPGSVSVIRYTPTRPFVMHLNDHGNDLGALRPPKRRRKRASSDAAVGGGAGSSARGNTRRSAARGTQAGGARRRVGRNQ
ncbi:MAG TPA: histidine phosphatase family protein [Nocardioidaceae bacterium]|nr:histidine phosphatase family protein [Nocardioidaceae bacterium]